MTAAITARNVAEVEATAREIQKEFSEVKVLSAPADGCKTADLEALVKRVNAELGPIDLLVCNAGTNSELRDVGADMQPLIA